MNEKKTKFAWIKQGIFFALFMYIFMELLFPLLTKDPITTRSLLIGIPAWAIAGFVYAYIIKRYPYVPKGLKKKDDSDQ